MPDTNAKTHRAGNYASSFDDLLDQGRRQFRELAGDTNADQPNPPEPAAAQPKPQSPDGPPATITGTSAGIRFTLTPRR